MTGYSFITGPSYSILASLETKYPSNRPFYRLQCGGICSDIPPFFIHLFASTLRDVSTPSSNLLPIDCRGKVSTQGQHFRAFKGISEELVIKHEEGKRVGVGWNAGVSLSFGVGDIYLQDAASTRTSPSRRKPHNNHIV